MQINLDQWEPGALVLVYLCTPPAAGVTATVLFGVWLGLAVWVVVAGLVAAVTGAAQSRHSA